MTPYSFTVSLWFPCMLGTFGERTTLVPRDQKKNQTKGSQTMGVWLINHTASLSNMETTASERQSLSMHDFPIYPKSSTTLSNLFVPFCTQTEPVNKGIQNLTCPSIQTKHVARLVRSCTARLNSSSVIMMTLIIFTPLFSWGIFYREGFHLVVERNYFIDSPNSKRKLDNF